MPRNPDVLTLAQAARELGVSRPTLYTYEQHYGLPVDRSGARPCIERRTLLRWARMFTPPKTGRPSGKRETQRRVVADDVGARIARLCATGMTWREIAKKMEMTSEACRRRFYRWCERRIESQPQ